MHLFEANEQSVAHRATTSKTNMNTRMEQDHQMCGNILSHAGPSVLTAEKHSANSCVFFFIICVPG